MEITEVRIKLVATRHEKLRAFCSITIDECFVVRDLRIIEGSKGPFVAMPSRKLTQRCSRCGGKNPYRTNYCGECGTRLPVHRGSPDVQERTKLHADVAHPINSRCRELIQRQVLESYAAELVRAQDPGYRPAELDAFDEDYLDTEAAGALEDSRRTSAPDAASEPEISPRPSRAGADGTLDASLPADDVSGDELSSGDLVVGGPVEDRRRRDAAAADGATDRFASPASASGAGGRPRQEWRGEPALERRDGGPPGGWGRPREGSPRARPREGYRSASGPGEPPGQHPGRHRSRGDDRGGGRGQGGGRREEDRARRGWDRSSGDRRLGDGSLGDRPGRSPDERRRWGSEGRVPGRSWERPVESSEGARPWERDGRTPGAHRPTEDDLASRTPGGAPEPPDRDAFGAGVEEAGAAPAPAPYRAPADLRPDLRSDLRPDLRSDLRPDAGRPREADEGPPRDWSFRRPVEPLIRKDLVSKDLDEPEDNFGAGIFS